MASRVVVTGASGFIGRHLVQRLLAQGDTVLALTRPGGGLAPAGSEAIHAPLTPDGVTQAAQGCDVVYHLAGLTRASTPQEFFWANAEGTRAAAMGALAAKARLVYVSSLAAAGPGTPKDPRRESDPPKPITAYGQSKRLGEERLRETTMQGLQYSIVRPPGVYGPGDKDFLFAFQSAKRGFFPVLGDPNRAYTLVFVDDLVDAIIAAGTQSKALGQTYFAGHAQPVQWQELLQTLARLFEKPYKPLALPKSVLGAAARLGELGRVVGKVGLINREREKDLNAPGWVCDVAKIKTDLGIEASTTLENGFRQTLEWYVRHGWV